MNMLYTTDAFFENIYLKFKAKSLSEYSSPEMLLAECEKRKQRLKTILGIGRLETIGFEISMKQLSECEYIIKALPELSFPLWILRPQNKNGKTVLYVSGHDKYGACGSFNDYGQSNPFHMWLPKKLCDNGYTVVIPELMGFGDMVKRNYTEEYNGCYANTEIAQLLGLNIAGLRIYQLICVIKALSDIGCSINFLYGISGGGLIASLTSALCNSFDAIVISNYGATFKSSIMVMEHCVDNYIPSLIEIGECADIIALGAPKPLLLSNGTNDRIFPIEGVRETVVELKKIYSVLGVLDNFQNHFHSGGHEAETEIVINFLGEYL